MNGRFDLAFAYESIARAYAVIGDENQKEAYIQMANEASVNIEKKEDLEYFLSELATV